MLISYKERLAALRRTKIEHTLAKRTKNGYMDADDYGTVPLQEGYTVEPWYNGGDGDFFGLQGMSENFARLLDAHPAYVDPLELLCGRWRDMLENYRKNKWDEKRFPYEELKPYQELYNISTGIDSDSHFACDYTIGLTLGFGGFLDKIKQYRAVNPDKAEFYDAEEKTVLAIIRFIDRHIAKIEELLLTEERPEIRASLTKMREANKAVRTLPPKSFWEACQWVAYFNCVSRVYTRDGAGFQLDTVLKPYFDRSMADGTLDEETAKFLIANLLLIDPHYYQISGVDENDCDITNPLSYVILEGARQINIANNLTVRVHKNCDPAFLRLAVACLFETKNGWPRFCGDESLVRGYMKTGCDILTARSRIAVGCHWTAVPGREFPMNDTVKINIAKVLDVALAEMRSAEGEQSTERLFGIYESHLTKAVEVTAAGINLHLDHQAEVSPELVMNLMMKNTLETGTDITRCAELYTIGIDGAGLAVVADSFAALQKRVEEEKLLTWEQVYNALESDFDGAEGERIRRILASSPRYCQGGTIADKWAQKLTESFSQHVRAQKMPEGRQLIPGWFSWSRTIYYGSVVGATPNGRHRGKPISHGANPNPGFRTDGAVTAQASGIASVQTGYGNTVPLQLEFDPQLTQEEGGVEIVENLIRTHFEMGGTLININVLDGEKLMEANDNPDLYPDLVVRVTGFTAYFAALSPEFRQLVIDRFLRGM